MVKWGTGKRVTPARHEVSEMSLLPQLLHLRGCSILHSSSFAQDPIGTTLGRVDGTHRPQALRLELAETIKTACGLCHFNFGHILHG